MRRWAALVCVVALLAAAAVVPVVLLGGAVEGRVAAVQAPVPRPGQALRPVPLDARESPAVALLLFRAPPSCCSRSGRRPECRCGPTRSST